MSTPFWSLSPPCFPDRLSSRFVLTWKRDKRRIQCDQIGRNFTIFRSWAIYLAVGRLFHYTYVQSGANPKIASHKASGVKYLQRQEWPGAFRKQKILLHTLKTLLPTTALALYVAVNLHRSRRIGSRSEKNSPFGRFFAPWEHFFCKSINKKARVYLHNF
jgi:hypothetical protein